MSCEGGVRPEATAGDLYCGSSFKCGVLSVLDDEDDAVEREELEPAGRDDVGMVELEAEGRRIGRGGGMGEGEGDLRSFNVLRVGVLSVGVKNTVSVGEGSGDLENVEAVGDTDWLLAHDSTLTADLRLVSILGPMLQHLLQGVQAVHYSLFSFDYSSNSASVDSRPIQSRMQLAS
jgi:hypothetical protein